MSEEDGVFLERSFQRTLIVCRAFFHPDPSYSFTWSTGQALSRPCRTAAHIEIDLGTRKTNFVLCDSDCCLETDWGTLSGQPRVLYIIRI